MRRFFGTCSLLLAGLLFAAPASAATVVVNKNVTADTTWTADNVYVLQGAVFVNNGATLTIEAGTLIIGDSASLGTLIISQGAKIDARGTADAPIVMTSDQPVGQRRRADWGGLIINGYAPLNVPGGEGEGEGDTGTFGGSSPNDDSGTLQYLRVEFAGTEFSPDNELNGIAFQGVGRGTTVDHIQVHMNKDDGVEFFGGTVNLKYVVLTGNADDSFDVTEGWTGMAQFVFIQQYGDDADNGFEIDNNAENNTLKPTTNPRIYNVTAIGDPSTDLGSDSDLGMLVREGAAGNWANMVVMGFKEWGIEINHTATFNNAKKGDLVISNSYWFDNGSALARELGTKNWSDNATSDPKPTTTTAQYMVEWPDNVEGTTPPLRKPYNRVAPDPRPKSKAWKFLQSIAVAPPADKDGFFDTSAEYAGAFAKGPKGKVLWFLGWASFPPA